MPPLRRTESLIEELLSTPSDSVSLKLERTDSVHNSESESAARWVTLPPPPLNLPKSFYIQYSSPLGPRPRKLYRRVYPRSLPKPDLYRRALMACAEKAAERILAL
jgi:hypothetical protein